MINETQKYQGVVFGEIARKNNNVTISRYESKLNSVFIVNEVGIFIKYSTKRMSPWHFTFTKEHQEEILKMQNELREVVVLLVCSYDGVASLNYEELKSVLDEEIKDMERITVSRPPRGKYRVSGSDGKMKNAVGQSEFPGKIFG